jgi:hypothetical protein
MSKRSTFAQSGTREPRRRVDAQASWIGRLQVEQPDRRRLDVDRHLRRTGLVRLDRRDVERWSLLVGHLTGLARKSGSDCDKGNTREQQHTCAQPYAHLVPPALLTIKQRQRVGRDR